MYYKTLLTNLQRATTYHKILHAATKRKLFYFYFSNFQRTAYSILMLQTPCHKIPQNTTKVALKFAQKRHLVILV